MKEKIKQGAEAILYREDGVLIKERIPKKYRVKELDEELRTLRTRREVRCLTQAMRSRINVPKVLSHDDFTIKMEFIDGERVKEIFNKKPEEIAEKIGEVLAKLHQTDIVHGDPTTSNMIYKDNELFLIDFGLSEITNNIELKATDLYVLEEAIRATHIDIFEKVMKTIRKSYKKNYNDAENVLEQLRKIRQRVRYANKGS